VGKFAQYRKRGAAPSSTTRLPSPPPPTLADDDDNLISLSTGGPDEDGHYQLWKSATGLEPWTLHATIIWAEFGIWGEKTSLPAQWLRSTELGNNRDYTGESSPSNPFNNT